MRWHDRSHFQTYGAARPGASRPAQTKVIEMTATQQGNADNTGTDVHPGAGPASFRRIVHAPFGAWAAALETWQLTRHDGELRLGHSVLRGPIERDQHFGTWRVEVRLARGPLRPRLRMRLDLDHWSATSTALELIPCQRVRPSAAYFRAGRALLDSLAHTLPHPPSHADLAQAKQAHPAGKALAVV